MKYRHLLHLIFILMVIMHSCQYEFIVPEIPFVDPDIPVKFSEQIAPIFSTGNQCTACHNTGGTPPDLTSAMAHNSIVPNLINSTDPETSRIYWHPNPSSTNHAWKKYSANEAALILEWIKQGALNN